MTQWFLFIFIGFVSRYGRKFEQMTFDTCSIKQLINQLINQSTNQSNNQQISRPIDLSINQLPFFHKALKHHSNITVNVVLKFLLGIYRSLTVNLWDGVTRYNKSSKRRDIVKSMERLF